MFYIYSLTTVWDLVSAFFSSEREIEILDKLGMNKTIPATANTSTQGPIPVTKKDDPYCDRTTFGLTFSGKYF